MMKPKNECMPLAVQDGCPEHGIEIFPLKTLMAAKTGLRCVRFAPPLVCPGRKLSGTIVGEPIGRFHHFRLGLFAGLQQLDSKIPAILSS